MYIGFSCEKVIEMDIEDTKIRIVANSFIEPDSTITVNVTRSRHILDNADILPLSDAEVKLYDDGIFIGTLTYTNNGNYYINYIPEEGHEYKIEVNHNSYDNVYAQTSIPYPAIINNIDTIKTYSEYGDEIYNLYVNFNDPENIQNFYYIKAKVKYQYEEWDPDIPIYYTVTVGDTTYIYVEYGGYVYTEYIDELYLESDDIIIETEHPNGGLIFSDELIEGTDYTLRTSFYSWSLWSYTNMVYIDLYSINRDYYNYVKSYEQHRNSSEDPFAQPVNVYTNIVNGIGIFGASSKIERDSILIIGGNGGHVYID